MYFLWHVGHFNWYTPFLSCVSDFWVSRGLKSFPRLLLVVNSILTLVCFNSLVICLVSFPMYVNLAQRFRWFSESRFVLLFLILLKMEVWNLLLQMMCFRISVSLYFSVWPMSYVSLLFIKYRIAANFCSDGWHESLGMVLSEVVGFLYMLKTILFVVFLIVRSKKFNPLSCWTRFPNSKMG